MALFLFTESVYKIWKANWNIIYFDKKNEILNWNVISKKLNVL
jgi:hypothetical protein